MTEKYEKALDDKMSYLELAFFAKYCRRCIGTKAQKLRKCASLSGHNFLACDKQERFFQRHSSKERNECATGLVNKVMKRINDEEVSS